MSFTKVQAKQIMDDMKAALDVVAKKHGLISQGFKLTYSETIDIKVGFAAVGGKSKIAVTYDRYRHALGLPQLGAKMELMFRRPNGNLTQTILIEGLRVGGPYKSLVYRNLADNKSYKMSVDQFLNMNPVLVGGKAVQS